jgi:DNA-binding NtrC family response regulator
MAGPIQIVALSGRQRGVVHTIPTLECRIGRGSANHIDVSDLTVSRSHCLLLQTGDDVAIRDLGSINGTYVNGEAVLDTAVLRDGDEVQLGDSRFLISIPDSPRAGGAPSRLATAPTSDFLPTAEIQKPVKTGAPGVSGNGAAIRGHFASLALSAMGATHFAIVDCEGSGRVISASVTPDTHALSPPLLSSLIDEATKSGAPVQRSLDFEGEPVTVAVAPLRRNARPAGAICGEFRGRLGVDSRTLASLASYAALLSVNETDGLNEDGRHGRAHSASAAGEARCSMIGDSRAMQKVYNFIARVARTDSTVVITGESGTGKELCATSLHARSARSAGPFVALNCATLSENLLESELFGFEKGAFTGAVKQKKGKVEIAHRGVLFLDELGELPLVLQPKLLRFLQEREFERVGGTTPIRVDVRIVAATNCDLPELVASGRFRSDLFYRLMVCQVTMPPLRDRLEDIPLLTDYLIGRCSERVKRRVSGIANEAMAILQAYSWPGNVRELENTIERAIVLGQSDVITPDDLPLDLGPPAASAVAASFRARVEEARREIVLDAFAKANYDHAAAASILQIHPNNLHRVVRSLGLHDSIHGAKMSAPSSKRK